MDITVDSGFERPCNYIHLKTWSPLFDHYVYADVVDYYADELFRKHRVHVFFGEEAEHPENMGYRLIFCKFFRWEKLRFLAAMNELQYIMDLNGRHDYDKYCEKFIQITKGKVEK